MITEYNKSGHESIRTGKGSAILVFTRLLKVKKASYYKETGNADTR
jgi:hypothetical protein